MRHILSNLHIVLGMAPVPFRIQVPKRKLQVQKTTVNSREVGGASEYHSSATHALPVSKVNLSNTSSHFTGHKVIT